MNSDQSKAPQEFHVPETGPLYENEDQPPRGDQNPDHQEPVVYDEPVTVEDQDEDEKPVEHEHDPMTDPPHSSTSGMETPDLALMSRQDILEMPGLSRRQRRRLLRRAATLRKDRS